MFYKSHCLLKLWSIEQFPIRNISWLLCRNWQVDPHNIMEIQGTQSSQNDLKGEQSFMCYNLKAYYKATVTKTMWY